MNDSGEWVKINRHLQSIGTATCDVSNLIYMADEEQAAGNGRVAERLMWAARDVLRHRKLSRRNRAVVRELKAVPKLNAKRVR